MLLAVLGFETDNARFIKQTQSIFIMLVMTEFSRAHNTLALFWLTYSQLSDAVYYLDPYTLFKPQVVNYCFFSKAVVILWFSFTCFDVRMFPCCLYLMYDGAVKLVSAPVSNN